MRLPKTPSGTRYAGSTDRNTRITITQPNAGNSADGTPLGEQTVASVWASVSEWRGKQQDKAQTQQAQSSYRIVMGYPQTYSLDTGMLIHFGNHLLNIDSFSDPDGNNVELHIWAWEGNPTVVN